MQLNLYAVRNFPCNSTRIYPYYVISANQIVAPSASARIDSLVELIRRAYMRPGDRSELLDAILMRLSNSELINDLQLTRCLYTCRQGPLH